MEKSNVGSVFGQLEITSEPVAYTCSICQDSGVVRKGDRFQLCECAKAEDFLRRQRAAGITAHLAKMTFEDFDFSYYDDEKRAENGLTYREGMRRIVQAAKGFVADIAAGKEVSGLLFQGDVAAGKTFLAASIANALVAAGKEPLFVVVPDFLDEIRSSFGKDGFGSEHQLMDRVKNAPILILDDLGVHNYTEWSIRTIFAIINYRINHELPLVVTTNLSEEERDALLGARINSRLMEACRHYRVRAGRDIRYARRRRESMRRK